MKQTFKQTMRVALAVIATAAVTVGLPVSPASAAGENTFIRNLSTNQCVVTVDDDVLMDWCREGNLNMLWDRQDDATIHRAFTGLCLDSDFNGAVYFQQCNGGLHQKWGYLPNGWVQNLATGRFLDTVRIYYVTTSVATGDSWEFLGG
ncbi:RICIN domain-containing protein [Nonomuraea sp. CA-141351]|uniref:RICIN domain-containing protein n=1 Tax=Nonomuraea sp. CA-141351 TaxID=3239996 RepID=UPI003D929F1B